MQATFEVHSSFVNSSDCVVVVHGNFVLFKFASRHLYRARVSPCKDTTSRGDDADIDLLAEDLRPPMFEGKGKLDSSSARSTDDYAWHNSICQKLLLFALDLRQQLIDRSRGQ